MQSQRTVTRRKALALSIAAGLGLVGAPAALAQAWPEKSVRVIVPYPAGAVGDVMMRIIGERLGASLGQAFVVENRAGGGGMAATRAVADAAPDGYTLLFNGPNHVTNLGLYKNVPYDPVADFVPVTHVGSAQTVLVANTATDLRTMEQVVAAAKAKPMGLNYASSGAGTGTHLAMEMLMRATGSKLTHVAYKGASPAAVALGGGEVQLGFAAVPLATPLVSNGRVTPIVVGGNKRLSAFPEVPSLGELGMLNYDVDVWFGLLAPRNTPAPVVDKLAAEVRRIMADPAVVERFDKLGISAVGSSPTDFDRLIKSDLQRWPQLIRELGIQAN